MPSNKIERLIDDDIPSIRKNIKIHSKNTLSALVTKLLKEQILGEPLNHQPSKSFLMLLPNSSSDNYVISLKRSSCVRLPIIFIIE